MTATLELMAETGTARIRIDDVAAKAGVSKATIYRRHRTRDELIAASVADLVSDVTVPDSGSTRDDLLALMRDAVRLYTGPLAPGLMPGLVAEMAQNPELATTVREQFLAVRRNALRRLLERGVERGELRNDLDYDLALDVLVGPLFYRLLVTGAPIEDHLASGVVELILRGFAPTNSPRRKTGAHRKET